MVAGNRSRVFRGVAGGLNGLAGGRGDEDARPPELRARFRSAFFFLFKSFLCRFAFRIVMNNTGGKKCAFETVRKGRGGEGGQGRERKT